MKTAEEWAKVLIDTNRITPSCTALIGKIQLDAMREGMRRAAFMANEHSETFMKCDKPELAVKSSAFAVLAAAEQLTEKDL